MSFPDPIKQEALSKLKAHAQANGVKVESNREMDSMVQNIDQTFREVSRQHGQEVGMIEVVQYIRFTDETPPDPPYDHVRFDDPVEAQGFCDRVLQAHQIHLSVIPLDLHLFSVGKSR